MRRAFLMGPLVAAAGLSACGQTAGADRSASASAAMGPHLDLAVAAPRNTRYEMLCAVHTYQASPGQYVNRYGIEKTGPFSDVIPSASAHCTAKIDSGPAPVAVSLSRAGSVHTMTIDTVGDDGKRTLHVW